MHPDWLFAEYIRARTGFIRMWFNLRYILDSTTLTDFVLHFVHCRRLLYYIRGVNEKVNEQLRTNFSKVRETYRLSPNSLESHA